VGSGAQSAPFRLRSTVLPYPSFSSHGRHFLARCVHSQTYSYSGWQRLLDSTIQNAAKDPAPMLASPSCGNIDLRCLHLPRAVWFGHYSIYMYIPPRLPSLRARLASAPALFSHEFPRRPVDGTGPLLLLGRTRLAGRKGGDLAFKSMLTR